MLEKGDKKYELPDLHVWLLEQGLESELREHSVFHELLTVPKEVRKQLKLTQKCIPQHQLVIKGPMGQISAIQAGCSFWDFEIMCLEGDIFDGIRRYSTLEAAGKTILSLLTTGMFDESQKREFDVWNDFLSPDPEGSIQDVNLPPEWEDDDNE